jgi:integrase
VRFDDLRHAHATLMLLQGVHPNVASERLGHASVGITLDTYSHVLPSLQGKWQTLGGRRLERNTAHFWKHSRRRWLNGAHRRRARARP